MIDKDVILLEFYNRSTSNKRLLPSHLVLFTVIYLQMDKTKADLSVRITRKKIMQLAKIKSNSTYHRCVNDLVNFGYIIYHPSYNHYDGTLVIFTTKS